MKKLTGLLSAIFILVLMVGCTTQKPSYDSLHRQWMLVEFKNFSKDLMVKNKANLDLSATKSPKNQYNAFMGCNRMFMTAEFKDNGKVKFSDVGSTMMYCDQAMDLEDEFAKTLPTMTNYKIEGHNLILSDGKGNSMKFIASDWD